MRIATLPAAAVVAILALAPAADAATSPTVTTGGTTRVTQSTATLTGTVNPQGTATSYYFQYGPTTSYGAQSAPVAAGAGTAAVPATADIAGLAPATTYHYRLIATSSAGTTSGKDRTFKTLKQPLGLTLAASPNPAPYGAPITLSGQLTGTGGGGRTVVLQQNAFPYTTGFANVGNAQVTGPTGAFAFAVMSLTINTQYRVLVVDNPKIVSPIVIASSAVIVHAQASAHRFHSRRLITFSGSVRPREDGALYAIQKHGHSGWVTIAGSSLHRSSATKSGFRKRVRIRHSGSYRVFVGVADGAHVSSKSPTIRLRVVPRR